MLLIRNKECMFLFLINNIWYEYYSNSLSHLYVILVQSFIYTALTKRIGTRRLFTFHLFRVIYYHSKTQHSSFEPIYSSISRLLKLSFARVYSPYLTKLVIKTVNWKKKYLQDFLGSIDTILMTYKETVNVSPLKWH